MLSKFYPDAYITSVYKVDYEALYRKGYRAVMYDIDNTLVLHDQPANKNVKELFAKIHRIGLKVALISNNQYERVHPFFLESGADAFVCDAHKPSTRAYEEAGEKLKAKKEELIFFGDQLFTDVWGAKNANIFSTLVKPIGKEKLLRIKVKRILEKPILFFYQRKKKKATSDAFL